MLTLPVSYPFNRVLDKKLNDRCNLTLNFVPQSSSKKLNYGVYANFFAGTDTTPASNKGTNFSIAQKSRE